MTKLSKQAEEFIEKIIKYYPMTGKQGNERQSGTESKHKHPQQHLHDYRKERQIYDKPTGQKIENIRFFKDEGNNHYKHGRFSEASYFYQKAVLYGDYTFPEKEQDNKAMEELLQKSNCNLALCLIKLDQWQKARVNLLEAAKGSDLGIRAKALYWLTKYYIKLDSFDEAQKTIDQLKGLGEAQQKNVTELQSQLEHKRSSTISEERKLYNNMFKQ